MMDLLTPRFWIGLALVGLLAFTHGYTYRAGRAAVRTQWDAEKAVQVAAALSASEKRRNDEKALTVTNEGITHAYTQEKSRLVAARVAADGRLRDLQAALDRGSSADTASEPGNYGDPRSEIITQCASTVAILDEAAQRLAGQTTALQRYIGEVCLKP